MPVEPVHTPNRISTGNPKFAPERSAGANSAYYDEELKKVRAKRELEEEEQRLEATRNPQPAEPPFKVSGGINLGTIDLQADRRMAEEKAEKERAAMSERADRERAEQKNRVEELEKQNAEIKDKLQATEINHLKTDMTKKIDDLQAAILRAGAAPAKGLSEQLAEIRALAKELGLQPPPAPVPGNGDFAIQLELKKLDIQMKREEAAFERQKFVDDRTYNLEMKRLEGQQTEILNRMAVEKEKLATWTNLPKSLGGVIAQALIDASKNKGAAPVSAGASTSTADKPQVAGYIEAGIGEVGEVECLNTDCKQPVAVGPTTRVAECSHCHTRIEVRRKASAPVAPAPVAPGPTATTAATTVNGKPRDLVQEAIDQEKNL